jgi:protein TonB
MYKFISKNIHYPNSARNMGQEGTVYVRFVVNDVGQVVDVEVIKGVSAVLDKEATRVIALMKKWKPGKQHNIPVNVRMVLPIKFQINE